MIHGQTSEEVAMDTAGAENLTWSGAENRKVSLRQQEIIRAMNKRRSIGGGVEGLTYAWL